MTRYELTAYLADRADHFDAMTVRGRELMPAGHASVAAAAASAVAYRDALAKLAELDGCAR